MRVTLEIELDIESDDVHAISRGILRAATEIKTCETRRKGLGTFFFDPEGRDIGCMMPWPGARDWVFIEGEVDERFPA